MTEIARHLNYPPSSTSALLKSLLDLGYLDCDRKARTYVPTARISLVGGWVRNRAGGDLETIAQALHEAMRLTTFIASRNQLYSQYIRVIQGTTSVRFYLAPGGLRLLPASTPGRVLLSQIGDDNLQRLLLRINAEGLSTPPLRFSDLKPAARHHPLTRSAISAMPPQATRVARDCRPSSKSASRGGRRDPDPYDKLTVVLFRLARQRFK
jgi:DNA-binding IclR family transcriptional regulator